MKKIGYLIFTFVCAFIFMIKVNAADLSISANAYTIYVGSSVTITASAQGLTGQFTFKSNNLSVLYGGGEKWLEDSSDAMVFEAKSVGTATITVSPTKDNSAGYSDGSAFYNESKTVTINVINKPVVQQPVQKPTVNNTVTPKSSVNYLSNLEIEGQMLTPNFNKETADYTIELESGTTSINIKASAEHNKASVVGAGSKNLTEGINIFEIIVTAENGSKRTYKISANVKEKDPIVVNIGDNNYTVIRKREHLIKASTFYSESSVSINGEDIPSYHGEVTGYTLVGLKDNKGVINLFVYDEENNNYTLYQEFNFSKNVFYPIEPNIELIPEGFSRYSITINEVELPCYKKNKNDSFVLLYGVNIENNHEDFYVYDEFEHTLQRYDDSIFDSYKEEIVVLRSIISGLVCIIAIVLVVSALQGSINQNSKKSKTISFSNKNNSEEKSKKQVNNVDKEKLKEAKLLEKELKRKEKEEAKRKRNKKSLDDTNIIDITNINIKRK